METKICSNYKQEKPISEFPKCKRNKDGLDTHCKDCRNKKNKAYREKNKEKVKEARKRYYESNKEHILKQKKAYIDSHKEQKAEYDKRYRQENKEKLRIQKKEWAKHSIEYKVRRNLRRRIAHALKGESKSAHTIELVGCSIEFLKEYISKMFLDGMSWDNYGQ